MTLFEFVLLIAGGTVAGFVSALAGGGSVVSIAILNELVGISVANGTNRIGFMVGNIAAFANFQRGGLVPWSAIRRLLLPIALGAAAGAWVATVTAPGVLRRLMAVAIIAIAFSVALQPSRWSKGGNPALREPWRSLVFCAIGFWGGFAQAGIGLLLLSALVLGDGLNLIRATAAKVALNIIHAPIAILFFASAAQIDFVIGGVMAAGTALGASLGSQLALRKGVSWVRWIVVGVAVVGAFRLGFFG